MGGWMEVGTQLDIQVKLITSFPSSACSKRSNGLVILWGWRTHKIYRAYPQPNISSLEPGP